MLWIGHKRIDETMLYVHVAEAHHREMPEVIRQAAMSESDPDARILSASGGLATPKGRRGPEPRSGPSRAAASVSR